LRGRIAIELRVAKLTVRRVEVEITPMVADIFVLPAVREVAKPVLLMVATASAVELQVTCEVRSCVVCVVP
jgi:hypothetical protein